jgi:hypothetical protein
MSDDSSLPDDSALCKWSDWLKYSMDVCHRSIRVDPAETRSRLRAAGFTDVTETEIRIYYSPWHNGRHEQQVGRWFNLGLTHGIEALSLAPMTRMLEKTKEEVEELVSAVKREICMLKYHGYCKM